MPVGLQYRLKCGDPRAQQRAIRLGRSMPLVLLLMAVAAALSLGLSGSMYLGLLAGSLAAGLGAVWLVSWVDRRMNLSRAAGPVFVVVFCGLVR